MVNSQSGEPNGSVITSNRLVMTRPVPLQTSKLIFIGKMFETLFVYQGLIFGHGKHLMIDYLQILIFVSER